MDSRIFDLLSMFNESERFCDNKEKQCVNYLLSIKDKEPKGSTPIFYSMKQHSMQYLKTNLENIETGDF